MARLRAKKATAREEIVRRGYDKIAEEYQANRHIFDNSELLNKFSDYLPKNAEVLDVGCGAGAPSSSLVQKGFEVIGVDFSKNMLNLAKKNVPKCHLIIGDIIDLGFRDSTFDGLIAFYSIIHVPREMHTSLFQGFHRILKPDAVMLVCIGPDRWEGVEEYFGVEMFWSHYSSKESLKIMEKAGIKIISEKLLVIGGEKHSWILGRNKI